MLVFTGLTTANNVRDAQQVAGKRAVALAHRAVFERVQVILLPRYLPSYPSGKSFVYLENDKLNRDFVNHLRATEQPEPN